MSLWFHFLLAFFFDWYFLKCELWTAWIRIGFTKVISWVLPRHAESEFLWWSPVICMLNQHPRYFSCLLMFENSYSVVMFLKASLRHNPLFPTPITCTEAQVGDIGGPSYFFLPSIFRVSPSPVDAFFYISIIWTISFFIFYSRCPQSRVLLLYVFL